VSWSADVRGRRAVDSRGVRRGLWTRWESLEPAHVALDLFLGDPAAAADVHGTQLPALHERVHRRATDAEDLRGLFGSEEKASGSGDVPKRLRITHVDLSWISRALVRACCRTTSGSGLQNISSSGVER
jgi:hypothetical protein